MKDSDEKIHTATRKLCISKQDLLYGFQTNMLNLAPISCSFIIKLPSQASTGLQAARQKLLRARLLNSPKVIHSSLPNSASITVNIQSTRTEVRCWFWPVWWRSGNAIHSKCASSFTSLSVTASTHATSLETSNCIFRRRGRNVIRVDQIIRWGWGSSYVTKQVGKKVLASQETISGMIPGYTGLPATASIVVRRMQYLAFIVLSLLSLCFCLFVLWSVLFWVYETSDCRAVVKVRASTRPSPWPRKHKRSERWIHAIIIGRSYEVVQIRTWQEQWCDRRARTSPS